MITNIVTPEDLHEFRKELLAEIKELLVRHQRITIDHWIKSGQVMDKLGISPGTLQNLRINGTLPFTKLGGIIFYDESKIEDILTQNESCYKNPQI